MSTRRIFVSPDEAIELVSPDNQSAAKVLVARARDDGQLHVFVQSQPFTQVWLDLTPAQQLELVLGSPAE